MPFDSSIVEALMIIGVVGAFMGLLGGFIGSAESLFGTVLVGVIGGIALAAIMRIANTPPIYAVGDGFSVVWGALGGFLLGWAVGRSTAA